jgi:hypothetical protein
MRQFCVSALLARVSALLARVSAPNLGVRLSVLEDFDDRERHAAIRNAIEFPLNQFAAAAVLDLSLETLRSWRRQGLGPPCIHIGQRVYYRVADIRDWIQSLPVEAPRARVRKSNRL